MRTSKRVGLLCASVVLIGACGGQQVQQDSTGRLAAQSRGAMGSPAPAALQGPATTLQGPATIPGGPAVPVAPAAASSDSPWEPRVLPLDLSSVGLDLTVLAPEGANVRLEFGAIVVSHGPRFSLEIYERPADLVARKKEIENSGLERFRRWVTDLPDTLVYEATAPDSMGKTEYHFVANVMAGGKVYRCEDTKGFSYLEEEVRAMLRACTTLTAK